MAVKVRVVPMMVMQRIATPGFTTGSLTMFTLDLSSRSICPLDLTELIH